MQPAPRSRDGDVQQTPLLGHPLLAARAHVGWEVAVVGRDEMDRVPLEALRRVHGAEHDEVLVEMRAPRQIGAGGGGGEHPLGYELAYVPRAPGRPHETG